MYRGNLDENERNQIIRELGENLRDIRKAQGLSIAVISDITKIQKNYLIAIEEGDLSKLPKGPYIRGFVRQYCEFLSAIDLWNAYDAVTRIETPQLELERETNETEQDNIATSAMFKVSPRWWIYIVIIISLTSAGWVTWNYRGEITSISTSPIDGGTAAVSRDEHEPATALSADAVVSNNDTVSVDLNWMDGRPTAATPASQEVDSDTTSLQSVQTPTQPAAATTTSASVEKNTLHIRAIANVWLSVSSGTQSLYSGTINPGDSKSFTITGKAVRVRYGNPSGAVVTWNGSTANPLGSGAKPMTKTYHPNGKVTDG